MDEGGLARIEEELRQLKRANKKVQKEVEDRALIAAGEGRVSSDIVEIKFKKN